jgi:hypothetical protein
VSVTEPRLRGRTRWSMACRCARQAAMGLLGHDPEPVDEETQLLWERGKLDEEWVVTRLLEPEFGADNIIRQKAVEWPSEGLPIGELHTDAFVVSEGLPIEIKSHANGEPSEDDFTQLKGQIHFDPDAGDVGVLLVVDRNLRREQFTVKLTDDDRRILDDTAAQIAEAGRSGELPARVCAKPSDGRAKFCPFIQECFQGWTPPDPINLEGERAELLAEAYRLKVTRDQLKEPYDEAEGAYKAAVSELTEAETATGVEIKGGGVIAKRAEIAPRELFSVKDARRAGLWTHAHDQHFETAIKFGGGHTRWTLRRDPEAPLLAEDFGDAAPWTDADLEGRRGDA